MNVTDGQIHSIDELEKTLTYLDRVTHIYITKNNNKIKLSLGQIKAFC